MKKSIIYTIIFVVIFFLVAAGAGFLFLRGSEHQLIELKGYSIQVPADWDINQEENTLIFGRKNEEKGRFSLLYQDRELMDVPGLFGYSPENPVVRESNQYATTVYELTFKEGNQQVLQYVFDAMPDSPPYKLVLSLCDVNERTAIRILSSVTWSDLSLIAPEKPMSVPEGEGLEQMVYTIQNEYGYFSYNISQLEKWMKKDSTPEAGEGLHVLSFNSREGKRELQRWHYLAYDGEKHYLFTYYQHTDGQYIFDNNPQMVKELKTIFSEEEDYTRYMADDKVLLEGPYNQYSESKDALLRYKGTLMNDGKSVENLVMEALPGGVVLEGISLQTSQEPYSLSLNYTLAKADQYIQDDVLDEAAFYQNSLVLLSLIDNVDQINLSILGNGKKYQKTYQREVAEEQFDNKDLREFAASEEEFTQFTEEVPKVTPPDNTGSGNKNDGTRAIKSVTVTMYTDSKIEHPETGDMVSVERYAKRYGVAQYLDKPIVITLYEKVEEGKTTMWAGATCEGQHIGTYPIKTIDEFDSLVSLAS